MRKLLFSLAAIVALFATSCVQSDVEDLNVSGGEAVVTLSLQTPNLGSRAIAEGDKATDLHYAVYDENWNVLIVEKTDINISTTIELRLVKNKEYNFVFWAQSPSATCYTLNLGTVGDLAVTPSIDVDYANANANDDHRDAFFGQKNLTVNGTVNETVYLKRPFAQINFGTNDAAVAATGGFDIRATNVTTKFTTRAYTSLNLATGEATGETDVVFEAADLPEVTTFTTTLGTHDWLAMNYILWPDAADLSLSTCKMEIAVPNQQPVVVEYPMAPARRNYRTNLVGSLLTEEGNIEVIILPAFEEDDKYGAIDGQFYIRVNNLEEFNAAFVNENVDIIILEEDIAISESKTRAASVPCLAIQSGKALTIDLNGHKLSSTSSEVGQNYNLFDVVGTLTVKNGTIESQHVGNNMAWSHSTNLFNVTAGGVLNIEGVTAKNLGGSDMAFVAHLNNWGEVTLNVKNSVLESPYIAVRVFNSGNDMNNVTIKGSTLKGTRSFWVQNYTMADFGNNESKFEAHKALLNFDIFNDKDNPSSDDNTFIYDTENKRGPVCYGFTNDIYFDQYGNQIPAFIPIFDTEGNEVAGVAYDPASATEVGGETVYNTIVVTDDPGLAWVASNVAANDGFAGKTIKLEADVDLANVKTNGNSFAPIGYDPTTTSSTVFKGTFDGNGKTIRNLSQNDTGGGYKQCVGLFSKVDNATIKNFVIEDFVAARYGSEAGLVASIATGTCVFEDITVKNGSVVSYNNDTSAIVGWANGGDITFKNINIGEDVTIHSLWSSYDTSVGGLIGTLDNSTTATFENIVVACKLDVYNDVCANYQYGAYRRAGMLIGNMGHTQNIGGTTYPNPAAANVTCSNVTVIYGKWMNYHYCEFKSNGHGSYDDEYTWKCSRVEASDWGSDGVDHTQCNHESFESHLRLLTVDQLFGGGQGVYGLATYPGVTVVYPEPYTCEICGQVHNQQ